jgi:hypothetical protein
MPVIELLIIIAFPRQNEMRKPRTGKTPPGDSISCR